MNNSTFMTAWFQMKYEVVHECESSSGLAAVQANSNSSRIELLSLVCRSVSIQPHELLSLCLAAVVTEQLFVDCY